MLKNSNIRKSYLFAYLALVFVLVFSLTGCKVTDFFTEVIITPKAEKVDEDNQDKITVNSPDASQESSDLTALDWTDDSEQSSDVENIVVYSSKPTTTLTTHHSIFDLEPLFPGIEASDGVRLVFDKDAILDHETDTNSKESAEDKDSTSKSEADNDSNETNGSDSDPNSDSDSTSGDPSKESGDGDGDGTSGDNENGDDSGGDESGDKAGDDKTSDPDKDDDGENEDRYKGFDGSAPFYNPNDQFAEVPHVNSIAVIGKQAAVMVQVIGGDGAICAMSQSAFYDVNTDDVDTNTSKSFSDVFGDECDDSVVIWKNDGQDPEDINIKALIAATGENGLIIYDQTLGDQTDFFSKAQRKELYGYNVTLAPIDLSSVQGMKDAAKMIGEALSESNALSSGWSSSDMADLYQDAIDKIVKATAETHGGTLACGSEKTEEMATSYRTSPVKSFTTTNLHCAIATDAAMDYTHTSSVFKSFGITIFGDYGGYEEKPLGFWMQAAGVADQLVTENSITGMSEGLVVLWPNGKASGLKGSGGAYSRWKAAGGHKNTLGILRSVSEAGSDVGGGLGSSNMPYIIVTGSSSNTLTGADVKDELVASIKAYRTSRTITPYAAFKYANATKVPSNSNFDTTPTVGDTNSREDENPFYTGLDAKDVVRVNPIGLLGSWTEASVESVLEAPWIATIYSESPDGCAYDPSGFDLDKLTITIDGEEYTGCKEIVTWFYDTFYRYDVDYDSVVVDQGL